jgi:hypothetical protein
MRWVTSAPGTRPSHSAEIVSRSPGNTANPHGVTKDQVGLDKVANLAPDDLPLSKAAMVAVADRLEDALGDVGSRNETEPLGRDRVEISEVGLAIRGTPGAMYRLARGIVFPENSGFVSQGGGFNVSVTSAPGTRPSHSAEIVSRSPKSALPANRVIAAFDSRSAAPPGRCIAWRAALSFPRTAASSPRAAASTSP